MRLGKSLLLALRLAHGRTVIEDSTLNLSGAGQWRDGGHHWARCMHGPAKSGVNRGIHSTVVRLRL